MLHRSTLPDKGITVNANKNHMEHLFGIQVREIAYSIFLVEEERIILNEQTCFSN